MPSKPASSKSQGRTVPLRDRIVGRLDRSLEEHPGLSFFLRHKRRPDSPPRPPGIPMPPVSKQGAYHGPPSWLRSHDTAPIGTDAPPLHSTFPFMPPRSKMAQLEARDPDYRFLGYCRTNGGSYNGRMYDGETPGITWYPVEHLETTDWCSHHKKRETFSRTRYEKGPSDSSTFVPRALAHRLPRGSTTTGQPGLSSDDGLASLSEQNATSPPINVVSISKHDCAPAPTFGDLERDRQNPHRREPQDIMVVWDCETDSSRYKPTKQTWYTPTCETGWQPDLVNFSAGQLYCDTHEKAETFYASVYTRVKANSDIPPLDINA